jgi:energy-converting hydrogenase Eha subunit B
MYMDMSIEVYLILFLIAMHLFWLGVVLDADKKVVCTLIVLAISVIVYIAKHDLLWLGIMIQSVFYVGALISIKLIKSEENKND